MRKALIAGRGPLEQPGVKCLAGRGPLEQPGVKCLAQGYKGDTAGL